ncbi:MAG: DNA repair protein RadA [Alphaproteobacteria bacterium]|nr:DNA repair protein RadA [Alphaproteobacteria bacterium]
MAKNDARFVCQDCGAVHRKWMGRCDACGAWNTIIEEQAPEAGPRPAPKGRRIAFEPLKGESAPPPRRQTGIGEFDRVCGGGLVAGSAVLVGGDPGIGKSTLLLQVVAGLSTNTRVLYISGEEAIDQVRLRAQRLAVVDRPVSLAAATNVGDVIASLDGRDAPEVVVIDSIQTMYVDALDSAPGTVAQVRAAASELIRVAKRRGITLLIVGHVTKEGTLAGPRVLEHMVDTVLYFEGERGHQFRILRSVKNRFGPTDEIGVFEMSDRGLGEVHNPSALFLSERRGDVSGAAVFAGIEGTRPLLVEIQALVAPTGLGTPRRAVVGWDSGRLAMILAVLETRCGLVFGGSDVYLNVAGGLRIGEPAADLAVAAALVSSLTGEIVPHGAVVFGEIGLSGEIRAVGQTEARLKEAQKLGFTQALMPAVSRSGRAASAASAAGSGFARRELAELADLVAIFAAAAQRRPRQSETVRS